MLVTIERLCSKEKSFYFVFDERLDRFSAGSIASDVNSHRGAIHSTARRAAQRSATSIQTKCRHEMSVLCSYVIVHLQINDSHKRLC